MRGLHKASAYYNKLEALKDWNALAEQARALGLADDVERLQPDPTKHGWRTIDKRSAELRALIAGQSVAGASSSHEVDRSQLPLPKGSGLLLR